jgi:O-antigen/teichoic acid export membrane protein
MKKHAISIDRFSLKKKLSINNTSFLQSTAKISSGTVMGQLCLIASAPIITRIFDPEVFGLFAIVLSIASIGAAIVTMRYEYAVTVTLDARESKHLLLGSLLVAFAMSMLCLLSIIVSVHGINFVDANHAIVPLLYTVPVILLLHGIIQAIAHWLLRAEAFHVNAVSKFLLGAGQASSQVTLGLFNSQAIILIVGYMTGLAAQMTYLLHKSRPWAINCSEISFPDLLRTLRAYWRYPAFSATSAMLTSSSQLLPALLIGAIYDPALAGLFALSQRVVGVPVRVVSQAASQVYMAKMPKLNAPAAKRLFLRTSAQFLALATIGALPIIFWGPALFSWIFGESWRETGEIVRLLMLAYVIRFVVMPVSQTLTIRNKQHWLLITSIGSLLSLIVSFGAGWYFELSPMSTIAIYSAGWSTMLLATWVVTWRVVLTFERRNLHLDGYGKGLT